MLETYTPFPLLSDAARKWRGPNPATIQQQQTQEEIILSSTRVLPRTDDRVPLKLSSRSVPLDNNPPILTSVENNDQTLTQTQDEPTERFASLLADRERKKLVLNARTKPLELPPYQPPGENEIDYSFKKKEQQIELKRKQQEERQRQILEAAFASDDEVCSESSWEVDEAIFSGDDED